MHAACPVQELTCKGDEKKKDVTAKPEGESVKELSEETRTFEGDKKNKDATARSEPVKTSKTKTELKQVDIEESKSKQLATSDVDANYTVVVKLYCHKCGELFDDFGKLNRHIFQTTDNAHKFKCANCKLVVGESVVHQRKHLSKYCTYHDHTSAEVLQQFPTRYHCEICGKPHTLLTDLDLHLKSHPAVKMQCPECPLLLSNFTELMYHYRNHLLQDNVTLKCPRCNLVFYSAKPYQIHCLAVHCQSVFIPYECILCPTVIANDIEKFLFHVQAHCRIKPSEQYKTLIPKKIQSYLTCEVCAQIFENREDRKKHEKVHPSLLEEKRPCGVCSEQICVKGMWDHLVCHQFNRFNRYSCAKIKRICRRRRKAQAEALKYPPRTPISLDILRNSSLASLPSATVTSANCIHQTTDMIASPVAAFLEWSSVEGDPSVAPSPAVMETTGGDQGSFPQPDLQYLDPSDIPSFF